MWTLEGITGAIQKVGDSVGSAVGVYGNVKQQIDALNEDTVKATSQPSVSNPTYDPNLALGDFMAAPNVKLLSFGLILLVFAGVLKLLKKK